MELDKKFSKERIIEEGRKYDYRMDFKRNARNDYDYAVRHGLMDEIFKDKPDRGYQNKQMALGQKQSGKVVYWTKERVKKESDKYLYRCDFSLGCHKAYAAASVRGWLDELFEDRPDKGYKNRSLSLAEKTKDRESLKYWTKERIVEEGRKYKYRNDFKVANQTAYQLARKKGYLDEIFKHAPNMGYRNKRYMKAKKEAKSPTRCRYWTEERIFKELLKYPTLKQFCLANTGAMAAIERNKMRPKIKEYLASVLGDMSREHIESIAKLYMTKNEFRKKACLAYRAAKYQKILKEVCAHMSCPRKRKKKENKK